VRASAHNEQVIGGVGDIDEHSPGITTRDDPLNQQIGRDAAPG